MVELHMQARRGSLQLTIQCAFHTPWTIVFGPSGAGKSTLLRIIAGLDAPDTGRIVVDGQTLTDTAARINLRPGSQPSHRGIGMVTQQSALFPHLSVAANVGYGLPDLRAAERQSRIEEVMGLVDALQLQDRAPAALSGGEAQRVSLARALAPKPHLLLLDEPLSALDAAARDAVLSRLQAWLLHNKIQTILVTHDAADALATSADVAVLQEGKLIALGPASQVLDAERQRLLARLAMNNNSPAL